MATTEEELIKILKQEDNNAEAIKNTYVECGDGCNLKRTVALVHKIMHS